MANIQQFHGVVSKCSCGLADHPEGTGERACKICFGRGFTASCLKCDGNGQYQERVAGAVEGFMGVTCIACGGVGRFGVNKPADWDETHPVAAPETSAELVAA